MKEKKILLNPANLKLLIRRKTDVLMVYGFLLAMILVGAFSTDVFMKQRNLLKLFEANIGLLMVTFAQVFVVSLGGVDLSVGSVISVVNVMLITLINDNPITWVYAFALALLAGALIGVFNGLLVVRGHMQPIIATLATQTIFAGVALFIMDIPSGTLPSVLSKFLTRGWGYVFPFAYVILITAAIWIIFNRTSFGRSILAIGGNEMSAESSGISVNLTKVLAFVASGIMAAIAGITITAYTTSGNPLVGESYTQRSITTAVVGGALLAGGKNSIIGCLASVLIMGIINNLLNLLRITAYYQYVLQGVILIAALALSAIRSNK